MGKAATVALTAVAPEAEVADAAMASKASRKITPGMAPGQVNETLQARKQQAQNNVKAKRRAANAEAWAQMQQETAAAQQQPTEPAPASPGAGPSLPTITVPAAAQTGSGFLLGLFAWALGLAYLRGGAPEVKKFMAAKFFNKTG